MTNPSNSTELSGRVSRSSASLAVVVDYLADALLPAFNEMRAAYGIEPAPPRPGPTVTLEQAKAAAAEYWALEALRAEHVRQPQTVRARPPDGLHTKAEAAAKLGCSIKTLDGYVKAGALPYLPLGHGKKRPRKRFTDAALNDLITTQTRKDVPCPSTPPRARHSSSWPRLRTPPGWC